MADYEGKEVVEKIVSLYGELASKKKASVEVAVTKKVDKVQNLMEAITALTKSEVLVGIPKDKTGRNAGAQTNASLAYIHEFGSAAQNIPKRPFIYPGINKATKQIVDIMRRGAMDAIDKRDVQAAERILEEVGMAARNSVVREIRDPAPPFAPLQPATIRARLRRTAAGRRKLRAITAGGKQLGMKMPQILTSYAQSTWDAVSGANMKPLIDTGQLRAAISYVVRKV
jgi:hypothetical protein